MLYCFDTSTIIHALRKKSDRLRNQFAAITPAEGCISEIVRAELILGVLKSDRPEHHRKLVDQFVQPFQWLAFSGDAVEHYASIRRELEARGAVIGPNDLLIAATARSVGAIMVTPNTEEFSRVPGLVVEDWTS